MKRLKKGPRFPSGETAPIKEASLHRGKVAVRCASQGDHPIVSNTWLATQLDYGLAILCKQTRRCISAGPMANREAGRLLSLIEVKRLKA